MGTDIHCHIEYLTADLGWFSFAAVYLLPRDYELFGRLAGLRGRTALIKPRGIPDTLGPKAHDAFWRRIGYDGFLTGEISPETAASFVDQEFSIYKGIIPVQTPSETELTAAHLNTGNPLAKLEGKPVFVSDPEAHTPTWLTCDEFINAVGGDGEPEYLAMIAAMRALEADGRTVRTVFWFDN